MRMTFLMSSIWHSPFCPINFLIYYNDVWAILQYVSWQQFPCYTPSENLKNSSSLVTPSLKSSCLVTLRKKSVLTTIVRTDKKEIPGKVFFIASSSESLVFKPFVYFYFVSRDRRTTHSTWHEASTWMSGSWTHFRSYAGTVQGWKTAFLQVLSVCGNMSRCYFYL